MAQLCANGACRVHPIGYGHAQNASSGFCKGRIRQLLGVWNRNPGTVAARQDATRNSGNSDQDLSQKPHAMRLPHALSANTAKNRVSSAVLGRFLGYRNGGKSCFCRWEWELFASRMRIIRIWNNFPRTPSPWIFWGKNGLGFGGRNANLVCVFAVAENS